MRPHVIVSNAVSPNGSLTGYAVDYGGIIRTCSRITLMLFLSGLTLSLRLLLPSPPKNRLILGKDQKGLMRPGRGGW